MLRKTHLFYVIRAVVLIALSVSLAVFLPRMISGESRLEYTSFGEETARSEGRIKTFIIVKPEGIHHIGDVIELHLVVVFDPALWEVSDEILRNSVPLNRKFEVRSREIRNIRVDEMKFLDAKWLVQCLECRDDKSKHFIDFTENGSQRMLVKNKQTSSVTVLDLPDTYIRFLPIPDNQSRTAILPRLPTQEDHRYFLYFVLAGVCLAGACGLLLAKKIVKRKNHARQDAEPYDKFVTRIEELESELGGGELSSATHSLYSLLMAFSRERGKSSEVDNLIEELSVIYSGEEVRPEMLGNIISRAKTQIIGREAQ